MNASTNAVWNVITFSSRGEIDVDKWNEDESYLDSKLHGANMGPIWGQQDPGGPHVGPMNFVIRVKPSNLLGCRYKAVQYNMIFNKALLKPTQ